jgi:hypothetical protein
LDDDSAPRQVYVTIANPGRDRDTGARLPVSPWKTDLVQMAHARLDALETLDHAWDALLA